MTATVLHVDTGREWRGGQSQVYWLMEGLGRSGWRPVLAAPENAPLARRARGAGMEVRPMTARGDLDAFALGRLTTLCRSIRPAVVHAHTARAHALAVTAARLAGVSARVVTRRTELGVRPHWFSRAKYRSGVSRYLAISRRVAESLIAGGVDPARVTVVYSGVPAAGPAGDPVADRLEARRRLGLPAGGFVGVFVGALTREKGADLALEAWSRLEAPATLVVVGDGPERERLAERAARPDLAGRVLLAGFQEELARLWPAFDLLVAPSRHEGLGTAVIQAMGAGVPVIVAAVGGLMEVVEDNRTGRQVPPDDPESLARVVEELRTSEVNRSRLARAGRGRAADFSVERMVSGTRAVYESLLGAPDAES